MVEREINEIDRIYERPWGTYKTLALEDGYQVKIIEVKSGGCLSLQKHFKRAEHWVVVKGTMTVHVGDEVRDLLVNESIYIPMNTIHRMENKTDQAAAVIEVQVGSYLGEDDIVRLEDKYGRT